MSSLVLITEAAEHQIAEAFSWWQENASPELFTGDLERGLSLLAEAPGAGAPFPRAMRPGTRRLLLRRIHCWIYYSVDPRRGAGVRAGILEQPT